MITILNESFSGLEPLTDKEVAELEKIEKQIMDLESSINRNDPDASYFERYVNALKPYQNGKADQDNFFASTLAVFKPCRKPKDEPDYTSRNRRDYEVSSEYWYTSDGVIRSSGHWGTGINTCDWALDKVAYGTRYGEITETRKRCGFCKWSDFVLKPEILYIEDTGEKYLATFSNHIGKDMYKINGTTYYANGYMGGKGTILTK